MNRVNLLPSDNCWVNYKKHYPTFPLTRDLFRLELVEVRQCLHGRANRRVI